MKKIPRPRSVLEETLAIQMRSLKFPPCEREYRFHPTSQWRFDFAWPALLFAVEVEGATPAGGRHQKMGGFLSDLDKYHAAMELGWTVYRTSGPLIRNGRAAELIRKLIDERMAEPQIS